MRRVEKVVENRYDISGQSISQKKTDARNKQGLQEGRQTNSFLRRAQELLQPPFFPSVGGKRHIQVDEIEDGEQEQDQPEEFYGPKRQAPGLGQEVIVYIG